MNMHGRAARLRLEGFTQAEVGDAIGVSERTVRRWESAGKFEKFGFPVAEEPDSRPEEPDSRPTANGSRPPDMSLSEARRRKEAALARKHEMDVAEREGELVPVETVEEVLGDRLDRLRRTIQNVPGWLPGRIPPCPKCGAKLARHVAEPVQEAMRRLLEVLSEGGDDAAA